MSNEQKSGGAALQQATYFFGSKIPLVCIFFSTCGQRICANCISTVRNKSILNQILPTIPMHIDEVCNFYQFLFLTYI
jgi:hypothetical protein